MQHAVEHLGLPEAAVETIAEFRQVAVNLGKLPIFVAVLLRSLPNNINS